MTGQERGTMTRPVAGTTLNYHKTVDKTNNDEIIIIRASLPQICSSIHQQNINVHNNTTITNPIHTSVL